MKQQLREQVIASALDAQARDAGTRDLQLEKMLNWFGRHG